MECARGVQTELSCYLQNEGDIVFAEATYSIAVGELQRTYYKLTTNQLKPQLWDKYLRFSVCLYELVHNKISTYDSRFVFTNSYTTK